MGERTPFTQRVDEDLQDFVADVSEATNLSNADVMDEALRRLRDNSTVTDDGQFVVDSDYGTSEPEEDEISRNELFENQQKILQMLGEGGSVAETSVPNKNSQGGEMDNENGSDGEETLPDVADDTSEAERKIASLAGEYDHDECIDPDEVEEIDFRASDRVAHTRRYILPAAVGMLNHELEHGTFFEPVEWSQIRDLLRGALDVSRSSVYNYRDDLVEKGVLLPHPSVDEAVVGGGRVEEARRHAASVTDKRGARQIDVSEMAEYKRDRYTDDPGEYIGEFVDDWGREAYYVSEDVYREDVWEIIRDSVVGIALTKDTSNRRRRPGNDDRQMYEKERAAGASRMLVGIINEFGVAKSSIHDARDEAVKATPDSGLESWAGVWADAQSQVEAELFGEGVAEDEAIETFREVVGVDPAEADEEEMLAEYKRWIKENHPDAGGGKDDVDAADFRRVAEARQALFG